MNALRSLILATTTMAALPLTTDASAQFGGLEPPQIRVAMQIGSAVAGANLCNYLLDIDAVGRAVRAKMATDGKLTAEEVGGLVMAIAGVQGMLPTILGDKPTKADIARTCSTYRKAFGPAGDQIPGLLKP